jgi:hypothetical protein
MLCRAARQRGESTYQKSVASAEQFLCTDLEYVCDMEPEKLAWSDLEEYDGEDGDAYYDDY